jgi:serine phosphatase RsbU (regulator of sigma subunit)
MQTANSAHILVVDDEPQLRELIGSCLRAKGFEVREAQDGEDGLSCLSRQLPDLLLCDVQMPRIGGLEVLKTVKQRYPRLPVIMISGAGFIHDVVAALRLGAWDYLIKPFASLAVVEHAVNQCLHRARLEQENRDYREKLEDTNRELAASLALLREDQEAGRQVQARLLPDCKDSFGEFVFSHVLLPSLYLSGDFFDCFAIDQRHLGFYIADVSGHGASSAFVTVLLKSFMSQMLRRYQTRADNLIIRPDKALEFLNTEFLHTGLGKYLTMFYCVIDRQSGLLHSCVGGHYPRPVFVVDTQASFIPGHGLPVGLFEDAAYTVEHMKIPPLFSLFMFSDGLLDRVAGNSLDEKEHALLELCSRPDMSLDLLSAHLELEQAEKPQDDITVFMLQRKA